VIVISGALVAVALVLLVIGLTSPALGFVYASIAVSALSCVFLVIGILQRRGEEPSEQAAAPALSEMPRPLAQSAVASPVDEPYETSVVEPPAADVSRAEVGGDVLVVAGRPRYHVAGCRYLTGKSADSVPVADARDEGFTACGVCKPDDALTGTSMDVVATPLAATARDDAPASGARNSDTASVTKTSSAPRANPPVGASPRAKEPVRTAAARKAVVAPSKIVAPSSRSGAKTAEATAVKPAARAAAASTPAGATASRRGSVVVIPDRGRFHRAECRYVRGAADAQELTKAQAARQGYEPCGVCSP
jgi:hypothetical protein